MQYKRIQTSMPPVRFEPMILVLERTKTVQAVDSAAAVTGITNPLLISHVPHSDRINTATVLQTARESNTRYEEKDWK
jgi:hypothetical protein